MDSQSEDVVVPESRVLIIMTGGTICMRPSPDGFVPARGFLDACLATRPSFNDGTNPGPLEAMKSEKERIEVKSLRTPISAYQKRVRYAVLEFEHLLDSSSIDAKGWAQIAETIFYNYRLYDGFVILHGTDSLAYSASALSFMLYNLGKPVVLTGSQAPMLELQNDATDNLLGSLIIAGHFMIPEVCLFFNYKLFRGNRATKTSASQFDAFSSPNHDPLATITSVKTEVAWNLVFRSTDIHPFRIQTKLETAVACLRIFPGISPDMVDGVLKLEGLRGLILETFGAGNAPAGADSRMTKVIADGCNRGLVIVNVSQCLSGSVRPAYAPAAMLGRAGVIFGHDMTSEAALTKLCCLLASPDLTVAEVRRQMSMSLRGELNGLSETHFQHPRSSQLSPRLASVSTLNYAIARGDHDEVKSVMRNETEWLLDASDYLGNSPMHLAASGPNLEILRDFLAQGASVHVRNGGGRTPLFLATSAGLRENVLLLRESGAHLHAEEIAIARVKAVEKPEIWKAAGLDS